jgi:predicted ATPase
MTKVDTNLSNISGFLLRLEPLIPSLKVFDAPINSTTFVCENGDRRGAILETITIETTIDVYKQGASKKVSIESQPINTQEYLSFAQFIDGKETMKKVHPTSNFIYGLTIRKHGFSKGLT